MRVVCLGAVRAACFCVLCAVVIACAGCHGKRAGGHYDASIVTRLAFREREIPGWKRLDCFLVTLSSDGGVLTAVYGTYKYRMTAWRGRDLEDLFHDLSKLAHNIYRPLLPHELGEWTTVDFRSQLLSLGGMEVYPAPAWVNAVSPNEDSLAVLPTPRKLTLGARAAADGRFAYLTDDDGTLVCYYGRWPSFKDGSPTYEIARESSVLRNKPPGGKKYDMVANVSNELLAAAPGAEARGVTYEAAWFNGFKVMFTKDSILLYNWPRDLLGIVDGRRIRFIHLTDHLLAAGAVPDGTWAVPEVGLACDDQGLYVLLREMPELDVFCNVVVLRLPVESDRLGQQVDVLGGATMPNPQGWNQPYRTIRMEVFGRQLFVIQMEASPLQEKTWVTVNLPD